MIVSPSILSADFGHLSRDIEMVNNSKADWIHIDIMDGVFVPNISFGFPILKSIQKKVQKPLDVHLMIVDPGKFTNEVKAIGAELMCVHYEACPHLHRTIQQIKEAGMKAGVALNPHTPILLLEDIICDLDLVLLMSVNPGFGGQTFITNCLNKVQQLKALIKRKKSKTLIEVDGGVNEETAPLLKAAGADVLVAGSYIFKAADPNVPINFLKNL